MSAVSVEPARRYLIDPVTGRAWRPRREFADVPMSRLRRWEDFEMVGLTDEALARPWTPDT